MRSRKGYHNDYQPNNSNQTVGRRVQEVVHSVYNNTNHGYQHRAQAAPLEFQSFSLLDEQEFLAYSQKLLYFNYPTAPTWKETRKSRDHDVDRNRYRNHSQSRRRNREEKIPEEDHNSNSSSGVTSILQKASFESQENEHRQLNCQQSYPCGLDQNRIASSSESCVAYNYPNSNGTNLPSFSQVPTVTCSFPIQTFPAPLSTESGSAPISPELPVTSQPSLEEIQMMTYSLGWPQRNEQPPTESEFTRYYREEQEQIVEMLRQIDYRHELQLDHGRASGDQQHIPVEARGVEWLRKLSTVYGDDYHRYHFRLLTSAPKERFIITLGSPSVHRSSAAKKRPMFIRRLRAKRKEKRLLPLKRRPLHDTTNSDLSADSSNDANFLCASSPDSNNVKRISERSFYSDSNGRQKTKRFCDETAVGVRLNIESKSTETVLSKPKVKEGDSLFGMEIDGDEDLDSSASIYEIIDDDDEDVANGNENVNSESKENNDGEILAECVVELRNESVDAVDLLQIERTEGKVNHMLRSENFSLDNGIIDCENINHKTMTSANEMDSGNSSDPRNDHSCHLGLLEADVTDGDCERERLETSAPLLVDDAEMEKKPFLHEAALSNIKCLKDGAEYKEDEQNVIIYREKEENREFEIELDTKTSKENVSIPVQEERMTLGKNKKGRKKKKRSKAGVQGKNQKVTDVVMEEKNNKQSIKDGKKQDKISNETKIQDKCKGEKGNGGSSTKQLTSSEVRECVELVETKKGLNASSGSKITDDCNKLISRKEQGNRKESKIPPARMGKVEQNYHLENDSAKEDAIENQEGISANLKKRSKSKENDILNGNDEKKVKRWERIEIVDSEQKSTNVVEEKNNLDTKIVVGKKVEKSINTKNDGEKVKEKMNEVENQSVKVELRTDEMALLKYYGHRITKEGVEMQKTVIAKCDKVMETDLVGRNGKEREMEKEKVLFGKHDKEREIEKEKVSAEKFNKEKEGKSEKFIVRKSDKDSEMEMKKISVGTNDKESEKEKVLFGKSDKEMEKGKGLIGRKGKKREIEKEKNLVGRSDKQKEGEKEKLLVGRSDKKKEMEKEKVLVEKSDKKREIEKEKSLVGRSEKEKEMEKEKALFVRRDKEKEMEKEKALVVRRDKEKVTEMWSVEKSDKEREMEKGKGLVGRSEKEREFVKDKISGGITDRDKEMEMEKVLVGRNNQEREMRKSNCFGEMGKRKEESDFATCYSSLPIIHGIAKRDDISYFLENEKSKVKFGDKRQIKQLLGEQRKSEEIQKKSKAEFDEDSAILSDEHWMSNKDTEEENRNQISLNEDSRSKMNNITECKKKGMQSRISSDDSLTFPHLQKCRKDGDKDKVMSIGWDLRGKEGKSNESISKVHDDTMKKMFPKQSMQMLRKEELDDDFVTLNAYGKIDTLIFVNGGGKRDMEMPNSEETKRKDLKMEDNKEHYKREVSTYSKQIISEKAKTDIKMDIDDSEERKTEIKLLQKPERNRICAGCNNLQHNEENDVNSAHCGNMMNGNWAKMSLSGDVLDDEMHGEMTKGENYRTDDKKIKTIRAQDIEEGSSSLNEKRSEVRKDNGRKMKDVCGGIDSKVKCNGRLEKEDEMFIAINEERDRVEDQKQNKTKAIGRNIADQFSAVQSSKYAILAKKDIDAVSNDMIEVSEVLGSKHIIIDFPVQGNVIINGERELPLSGFKMNNNRDNETNGRKSEKEYLFSKKASEGGVKRKKENNECEIKSKDTEDVSSKKREKPFPSNRQHDQQSFRENMQSGRDVALYNVREEYPKQNLGKQELTKFSHRVQCSLQDSLFDKCCNANGHSAMANETMLKGHRIDKNVSLSEGVIANGESNFRKAESTITDDEGGFRKAKSAIANEESRFGKKEATIANDDTSRFRKAQHKIASDESSFRREESAISNNQSGFCKAESIIANDESDFGKEETMIANYENIFRKSEGIIANDQDDFRKAEPCFVKNVEEEIIQMDERITGQKKRTFKSRKEEMLQSSKCGLETEQRDLPSIPKIADTCRNLKEFDNGNDRIGRIGMLRSSANAESSVSLDDSKTASFEEKNKEETKDESLMKARDATEIYDDRSRKFDTFQCSKSANGTMSSLKSKRERSEKKDAHVKKTSLLDDEEIVEDEEIGETCNDRIRKFDPSGWCVSRKETKRAIASINSKNIFLEKKKDIKAKDACILEEGEIVDDEEIIEACDDINERFRRLDFSVSRGGTLSSTDSKNKCLEKKRKGKPKSRFLKNGDRVRDREDETCPGRIGKFDTLECPVIQKGAVSSVDAKNAHLEERKWVETTEASLLEKEKVFGEEIKEVEIIEEREIIEEGEIIDTYEMLKKNTSREESLIFNREDYKTIKPEISIHLATRKTREHSEPFRVKPDQKNIEITEHFKERRSISSIKTDSSTGLQKQRIGALNPLKEMHCSEVSESFRNRGRESHVAEGDRLTAAAVIEKAAIHDGELNHLSSVGQDGRSLKAGAKTETGELFHLKNKDELQVALMTEIKADVSKPIELLDPYKNKMCDNHSCIQTGHSSKHRNQIVPQMNFLGTKIEDDARLLAYSRMKTVEHKSDIKEKVFLGNFSSKSSRKRNENALHEHVIFSDRLNEDDEGMIIYGEGKDNLEKVLSSRTDEGERYICGFDLSFSTEFRKDSKQLPSRELNMIHTNSEKVMKKKELRKNILDISREVNKSTLVDTLRMDTQELITLQKDADLYEDSGVDIARSDKSEYLMSMEILSRDIHVEEKSLLLGNDSRNDVKGAAYKDLKKVIARSLDQGKQQNSNQINFDGYVEKALTGVIVPIKKFKEKFKRDNQRSDLIRNSHRKNEYDVHSVLSNQIPTMILTESVQQLVSANINERMAFTRVLTQSPVCRYQKSKGMEINVRILEESPFISLSKVISDLISNYGRMVVRYLPINENKWLSRQVNKNNLDLAPRTETRLSEFIHKFVNRYKRNVFLVEKDYENNILVKGYFSLFDATHHIANMIVKIDEISILNISRDTWWMLHIMKQSTDHNFQSISGTPKWFESCFMMFNDFLQKSGLPITCLNTIITENNVENVDLIGHEITQFIGKISHEIDEENAMKFHHSYQSLKGDDKRGCQIIDLSPTTPSPSHAFYEFSGEVSIKSLCVLNKSLRDIFMGQSVTVYDCYGRAQNILRSYSVVRDFEKDDENAEFVDQGTSSKHIKMDLKDQSVNHSNIGYEFQSAISAEMEFAEQVLNDIHTKGISWLSDISGEGSKMIQGNGLHSTKAISITARKFNEQILCDEYNCSEVSENASQADCLLMAVTDKGTISKEERYLGKSNFKSSFFQGEFGMNYTQASQLSVEKDLSEYQEADKTSDYSNDETFSQWRESSNRNLFRKQIFNTAFIKGLHALQKNSVIDFNLKLPVKKMDQHIESLDCCQASKENGKFVGNVLMEKFSVTENDEAIKRLEVQNTHADVQCLIFEIEDGVMKKQSIHYGQDLTSSFIDDSFLIDSVNEEIEEINPKRRNETETNDKKLYRFTSLRNELLASKASHESSAKSLDAHRVLEESTKSVERTLEEIQKIVGKLLGNTFEKDFVPSVIFESRFDSFHISPAERAEIDDISEQIIHCLNDDALLDEDDTVKILNPSINSHIALEMTSEIFEEILDDVCREEISDIISDINVRGEQVIDDVCKKEFFHDNKIEEQVIDDVGKEDFTHCNEISEEQATDDVCKKEILTSISDIKNSGKKETKINLCDISSKNKEDEQISCGSLDFRTICSGTEFKAKVCVNDSITALEDFTKDSNLIRLTAAKLVKRILHELYKDELSALHSHRKKCVKDITDGLSELSGNEDKSVEIIDDLLICNEAEKTTKQIMEYVCEEEFLTNPKEDLAEVKLSGMQCLIDPCSAKLASQEGEEELQSMTDDGKRKDENFCEEMFSKLVSSEISEINTVNSSLESFPSAIGSNTEKMFLEQMAKEGFIGKFSCGYGKSEEKSNAVLDLSISKASVKLVKRMLEDVCNDLSEADGHTSEASSDYWQGMSLAAVSSKMSSKTEQRLNSFDGEAFSKSYCTDAACEKNRKTTPGSASDFRLSSDAQMIPHHVMEHSCQQETAIIDDYEDENFKISYSHFKLRETCKVFVNKILDDVHGEAFPSLRNEIHYSREKDRFHKISSTFKERDYVNQYCEENVSKIPFDNMLQEKGLPNPFVVLPGLCLKSNTGKRFKENVIKYDNEEKFTHDNVQRTLDISISKAAKSLVEKVLDDVITTEFPISQEDSLSYHGDVKRNHYSVVPRPIFKSEQANQKLKLMKGKKMSEVSNDVMMPKCDMKTVLKQSFDHRQAHVTTEECTEEIFSKINENKLFVALGQDLPVKSNVLLDCREGSNPAANVSEPVLDYVGTEEFRVSQKEYLNVGRTTERLNPICSSLPVLKSVENMIKYPETFEAKNNYEQVSDQKCVSSMLSARSDVKAFQDVGKDSSASLRSDVSRDNTIRCFTSGHVFRKNRDHFKNICLNSDDRDDNISATDEHENPRFTPDDASLQKCATEAVEKVLEATIEELLESTEFGTLLIPRETTVSGPNDNEVFSYGTKNTNPGIQTLPTSKQMEFDKEVMSASGRETISKNNSKAKVQTISLKQFFFLSEIAQRFVETVLNDVLEELQSKKYRYSPLIERDKSPDLTSYEWLSSDAALLMVEHVLKEVVREECVMLSSSLLCGRDSLLYNAECGKNPSWSEGVIHDANSKLRKRSTLWKFVFEDI